MTQAHLVSHLLPPLASGLVNHLVAVILSQVEYLENEIFLTGKIDSFVNTFKFTDEHNVLSRGQNPSMASFEFPF